MSEPYRLLVTGSRNWTDKEAIRRLLMAAGRHATGPITLVHGAARGADRIAGMVAYDLGWKVEPHSARWAQEKQAAGLLRNQRMVDLGADLCLAFMVAESTGTRDCVKRARAAGIRTFVVSSGDLSIAEVA